METTKASTRGIAHKSSLYILEMNCIGCIINSKKITNANIAINGSVGIKIIELSIKGSSMEKGNKKAKVFTNATCKLNNTTK